MLGRDIAGDDVEQRALAAAVAADQSDAGAGRNAAPVAFQSAAAAGDADGEIVDDEHARLMAEPGGAIAIPRMVGRARRSPRLPGEIAPAISRALT